MNIKRKAKQRRDVAYWSEPAFLAFTEDLLSLMGTKVSQAELARRVGVSRGYISRVFSGTENLSLETMTKLAVAIGASVRLHVALQSKVTRWHDIASIGDIVADTAIKAEEFTNFPAVSPPAYSASDVGSAPVVDVIQ